MNTYSRFMFALAMSSTLAVPVAFAQTGATTTTTTTTKTAAVTDADITTKKKAADDALTAYKAAKATEKLAKLQALGDKLIDHRLASLNQFVTKLAARKGVAAADVTTLTKTAQDAIDGLTTLKTKIDADTTVEMARTDVASIFTSYRIYAVLIPKLHLLTIIDQGQAALDTMTTLSPRLQKAIDAAKTAGSDVTALTTAYTDYTAQLADVKVKLDAAKAEVDKMVAKDPDASKKAATAAREDIKTFRADLVAARGDITTIRDALKTLSAASTKSTTTTAPAATTSTSSKTTSP